MSAPLVNHSGCIQSEVNLDHWNLLSLIINIEFAIALFSLNEPYMFFFPLLASGSVTTASTTPTLPPGQCRPDQLICGDGSCLPIEQKCDFTPQCNDASDEDLDV